jgi:hypothetical protein
MIERKDLEIGTNLYAIQKCVMHITREQALTIGKAYPIIGFEPVDANGKEAIIIIDDQEDEHLFDIYDLHEFFTLTK